MKTYLIEQYETWIQSYTVEAESKAEAIQTVLDGKARADDNGLAYLELNLDLGLWARELDNDTIESLLEKEILLDSNGYVESIRSVEEV